MYQDNIKHMKNSFKIIFTTSLLLAFSFGAQAQKNKRKKGKEAERTINYKVEAETDADMLKPMLTMMSGAFMRTEIKGEKSKVVMDMKVSENVTITDKKEEKGLILVSVPMQGMRYAAQMTKEDFQPDTTNTDTVIVTYYKDKTKEIAGHQCTKVLVVVKNKSDMKTKEETTMYVALDLAPISKGKFGKHVNGTPLLIEMTNSTPYGDMVITMTASSITDSVDKDTDFSTKVPEGYEVKTMEEIKAMSGGK